jgi:CspA family cold shock protein
MEENNVFTGKVIWFSAPKGIGFIARADGKTDIFVHFSDIVMDGFKTLLPEYEVSFEEDYTFNGKLKASKVTLIKEHDGNK